MKKIICMILCLLMLIPILAACSQPPEYSEIEDRFIELVEASAEVNMIFFGEGLPTYERVYDPRRSTKAYAAEITDTDGTKKNVTYYYYTVDDDKYNKVIAYRYDVTKGYSYAEVVAAPDASRVAIYENPEESAYAYALEGYEEKRHELYYSEADPKYYDYVRYDSGFRNVSDIKVKAEKVYSEDYLNAIYESMFVGTTAVTENVMGLSARYIQYSEDDGTVSLMKSNEYKPLITETRVFDFETARIGKNSSEKYVNIEVESYLPSAPDKRLTVTVSMVYEKGKWMLNGPTY